LSLCLRTSMAMVVLLLAVVAHAGDKDKAASSAAQMVDAGSFGVFIRGQRVVSENFTVQQENGASTIKAQLKETATTNLGGQSSELQLSKAGELVRYQWSQAAPGTNSLVVTPKNEFLIEDITTSPSAKPAQQPFLMPSTTMIMDNNFFVHREVLVWRYLAADCKSEGGGLKCQPGPVEFGVLVPQDHASLRVRMELVGPEKVTIRGAERQLLRVNLSGDGFDWAMWVDGQDQFKLMRVLIVADNTEVVRD
jgi:hypothetical protein